MYLLSTSQGPAGADALGGQNYAGFSSLMMQGSLLFMNSFSMHAGGRGGDQLPGAASSKAVTPANRPARSSRCGACGAAASARSAPSRATGNASGVSYNLGGFVAGLDRRFAPNFRAGIATGFNAASLYSTGMPGYGTSNTLQFALYGEFAEGAVLPRCARRLRALRQSHDAAARHSGPAVPFGAGLHHGQHLLRPARGRLQDRGHAVGRRVS
jgi:hypothetical protein